MYGFGDTPPERIYTLQDYCDSIVQLIQSLKLEDVVIIGHSFGGRVALRLAWQCDKIKAIILTDSAGMKPRISIKKIFRTINYKMKKLLRADVKSCGSDDYRALSGDMRKTFINIIHTYQEKELIHINIPVLIIWGKRDKDTPIYMAKRLKRGIRNSRLVLIDGAHYAYLESHGKFVSEVRAFLNGVYFG